MLKLKNLIDPFSKFRNSRVYPRLIGLSASNTPTDNTREYPSLVSWPLNYQRTPTITLTRIESTFPPAGTNEYVRYMLNVSSISVHGFAQGIIDYRYRNFLKNRWQWPVFIESSPASNIRCAINIVFIIVWQTNW